MVGADELMAFVASVEDQLKSPEKHRAPVAYSHSTEAITGPEAAEAPEAHSNEEADATLRGRGGQAVHRR